jgi:Zn-finger nucleic acid-binding protein
MDLICPKCQGTMRTYERNGVHVDQCAECRGIFLDRGELERLVDAENAWHGGGPATRRQGGHQAEEHLSGQQPFAQPGSHQPAGSLGSVVSEVLGQVRAGSSHAGSAHGSGHRRKKDSFLSDLFG